MDAQEVTGQLWATLGGDPEALARLRITGPSHVLPSIYPVTSAATAAVATATLAAAELWTARGAVPSPVAVNTWHAALAYRSERLVHAVDRHIGDIWDPIAGVYSATDSWIRLHTNFRRHREAALKVLGLDPERAATDRVKVGQAVARWDAVDLEDAIYEAGGCAGVMRSREAWLSTATAAHLGKAPVVTLSPLGEEEAPRHRSPSGAPGWGAASRPTDGLRVLDLTRVIAGPVAGRFLAAYGADVLRVDAPGGEDGVVTVADTTVGKRSTYLDLHHPEDRVQFEQLVQDADVALCAYRPGALRSLGYGPEELVALRPGLVVATLSAYGASEGLGEPWGKRRGFDSLVQMVTGIAEEGRRAIGTDVPVPLPAQLLDHATGYLLAAGVLTALTRKVQEPEGESGWHVQAGLAATAMWLDNLGRTGVIDLSDPVDELPDELAVDLHGPLGHTRHIGCPGAIVGAAPQWTSGPTRLGQDNPIWT